MIDLNLVTKWLAIATGFLGIITFIFSIIQRKRELRWKQAELARKLIDDLFNDEDASQALYILDDVNRPYKDCDGTPMNASRSDLMRSINNSLTGARLDQREESIIFNVDSLLYFLNRIDLSLKSKLIVFDDIVAPFDYYLSLMRQDKEAFTNYMKKVGYPNLPHFCNRFPCWKAAIS
jgi:hypothetical protein